MQVSFNMQQNTSEAMVYQHGNPKRNGVTHCPQLNHYSFVELKHTPAPEWPSGITNTNRGRRTQGKRSADPHLVLEKDLNFKQIEPASSNANWLKRSKKQQVKTLWVCSYQNTLSLSRYRADIKKQDSEVKTKHILKALNWHNSCLQLLPRPSLQKKKPRKKKQKRRIKTKKIPKACSLCNNAASGQAHWQWFRVSFPLMYCYIISLSLFGLLFGRN